MTRKHFKGIIEALVAGSNAAKISQEQFETLIHEMANYLETTNTAFDWTKFKAYAMKEFGGKEDGSKS